MILLSLFTTLFYRKGLRLLSVGVILWLMPVLGLAVGISPPLVEVNELAVDEPHVAEFQLVRVPGELDDLTLTATVMGEGTEMISVPDAVVMNAADTIVDFPITITPTPHAAGEYEIVFEFVPVTSSVSDVQVSVHSGVQGTLRFSVAGDPLAASAVVEDDAVVVEDATLAAQSISSQRVVAVGLVATIVLLVLVVSLGLILVYQRKKSDT